MCHVTLKWAVSVINKLRLRPTLLMKPRISRQRTVVDSEHRGGWTQIFGGKASEPETYQSVEKRNFTYPGCIWRPPPIGGPPIGVP